MKKTMIPNAAGYFFLPTIFSFITTFWTLETGHNMAIQRHNNLRKRAIFNFPYAYSVTLWYLLPFSRSVSVCKKMTMLMIFQSLDVRSETGIKKHCYEESATLIKFFVQIVKKV